MNHYINDTMLIGSSEQEVASTLDLRPLCVRVEIKVTKIQRTSIAVKIPKIQWHGVHRDIPSKLKDKLLYLAPPTTKKEAQHLVGPL